MFSHLLSQITFRLNFHKMFCYLQNVATVSNQNVKACFTLVQKLMPVYINFYASITNKRKFFLFLYLGLFH